MMQLNDSQKIELANLVLNFLYSNDKSGAEIKTNTNIGTLNKQLGLSGFKTAEVGTPVFETNDRYFVILETIDGKKSLEVTYYKNSLKSFIDFYK